ncbi:MAG: (Fe-S)-binding protein [Dehalococcoidia bacterium]
MKETIDWARACTNCGECMDVCPTYRVTQNPLFSPPERLKTAVTIFEGGQVDDLQIESIYNCPKCMECEAVCPEKIPFTRVLHESRKELVRRGLGPTEKHNKVIEGILEKGNSVNGDPGKRLDWLPEEFPKHESDTLLYLGCLPSYLVKDSASSSYLVLKKLGVDFMILEDEGCCATYVYESGRTDLAGELFEKNVERFKALGIREMIVPCNGCLKCFKYFYPDLLGETGFRVRHIVEVLYDILKENPAIPGKVEQTATYQDQCRLARGEGITEEPRRILEWCGTELKDAEHNRRQAICCGAGAGIRSVYRDLSMEIAAGMLGETPTDLIVSACPFCTFNLNYTSKKKDLNKTTTYFTNLVLRALE